MLIHMIVAITGTPGTGKSTVAPLVADQIGYELIDLNTFINEHNLGDEFDEERNSAMVDTDELNDALSDELLGDDYVIDGHLAHFINNVDVVVVLRASPDDLQERLEQKDWDDEKIEENVMAERLDTILQESAQLHADTTYEVDTTDNNPETTAEEIAYLVQNPQERSLYAPGGTEWDIDTV
jgi:adenylate kinase